MSTISKPIVTVIIPVRNEEKYIVKCLNSILSQDYQRDRVEILIIDGISEDETIKNIKDFISHLSLEYVLSQGENREIETIRRENKKIFNIKILNNPKRIVPCGLNIGIKEATGEYIIRMDAHTEYATDYITKCVEWLEKTGVENVGGPMRAKGKGYVGNAVEFAHHCVFGLGGGRFHSENWSGFVDTVYLGAWPKRLFEKIGLFDERLVRNQDIEFNARIKKNKGKVLLVPEIKSYYYCRDSLKGLWKQNYENGRWIIYTNKIAPYCLSWRHFVPCIFVFSLLTFFILAPYFYIASIILFVISGSYALLNIFFSIKISIKNSLKYIFILPLVFATLHLSYGFGSVWGLLNTMMWKKGNSGVSL